MCDFTRPPPGQANWVPDSNLLVDTKGRRQSRRIKNLMDEAEAKDRSRRKKACILCGDNHACKDCSMYNVGKHAVGADVRRVPKGKSKKKNNPYIAISLGGLVLLSWYLRIYV